MKVFEHADNSRKFKAQQNSAAPYLFPSKISFRLKYLLYTRRYVHSRYDFSLKCLPQLRYGRHIECSYSPGASERGRGCERKEVQARELIKRFREWVGERALSETYARVLRNIAAVMYIRPRCSHEYDKDAVAPSYAAAKRNSELA